MKKLTTEEQKRVKEIEAEEYRLQQAIARSGDKFNELRPQLRELTKERFRLMGWPEPRF